MGIHVEDDHEDLLAQGFRETSVQTSGPWHRAHELQTNWCLEHCQGKFALRGFLSYAPVIWGYFELDSDAMLFRLRWS